MRGSAAAFVLVAAIQRTSSLLLLPFFARQLGPSGYGLIATLTTIGLLASTLTAGGIEQAIYRGTALVGARDGRFLSSIGCVLLGIILPTYVILAIAWAIFVPEVSDLAPLWIALVIATAGVSSSGVVGAQCVMRVQHRIKAFVVFSLFAIAMQAGGRVVAVTFFGGSISAWLVSDLVAALTCSIYGCSFFMSRMLAEKPSMRTTRQALGIIIPLIPNQSAQWASNLSDRLILNALEGARAVGLYASAYQIALVANTVNLELGRSYTARAVASGSVEASREYILESSPSRIMAITSIGMGASILGALFLPLIVGEQFRDARSLLYLICLGLVFLGWSDILASIVTVVLGKPRRLLYATGPCAVLNIFLNFALIPHFGAHGAAAATAATFLLQVTLLLVMAEVRPTWQSDLTIRLIPRAAAPLAIGAVGTWAALNSGPLYVVMALAASCTLAALAALPIVRSSRVRMGKAGF